MSENRPAPELPQPLRDQLRAAYQDYHQVNARSDHSDRATKNKQRDAAGRKLASLALAGRRAGWPVRLLAEPCGDITPERLRQIIRDRAPSRVPAGTPSFPKYERPRPAPKRPRNKIKRSSLTEKEAAELARLAVTARQNTGSRPLTSQYRKDSERFSQMIIRLHKRGVVWREMAEASGHTISGLRMRAARHGYGKGAPPSIAPYRRIVIHPAKKVAVKKDDSAKPDIRRKTA
jgi:hypothetical protein